MSANIDIKLVDEKNGPAAAPEKTVKAAVSRKLSAEEKKFIFELYESSYQLKDSDLPEQKDLKPKDVLLLIVNKLKQTHKQLTLFNSNKLLVIAKHILSKKYKFKRNTKSKATKQQLTDKIEKLSKQLASLAEQEEIDEGLNED